MTCTAPVRCKSACRACSAGSGICSARSFTDRIVHGVSRRQGCESARRRGGEAAATWAWPLSHPRARLEIARSGPRYAVAVYRRDEIAGLNTPMCRGTLFAPREGVHGRLDEAEDAGQAETLETGVTHFPLTDGIQIERLWAGDQLFVRTSDWTYD